jgi:hypothetical protein
MPKLCFKNASRKEFQEEKKSSYFDGRHWLEQRDLVSCSRICIGCSPACWGQSLLSIRVTSRTRVALEKGRSKVYALAVIRVYLSALLSFVLYIVWLFCSKEVLWILCWQSLYGLPDLLVQPARFVHIEYTHFTQSRASPLITFKIHSARPTS